MKIKDIINRLFYTETGQAIISAIFGISLALIFKRVCKENCVLYIAPNNDDINGKVFKFEEGCYKYSKETVKCNEKPVENYNGSLTPENKLSEPNLFTKLFA